MMKLASTLFQTARIDLYHARLVKESLLRPLFYINLLHYLMFSVGAVCIVTSILCYISIRRNNAVSDLYINILN